MEILGIFIGILIIMTCGFLTFKNFFKNRSRIQAVRDISLAVLTTVAIFTLLPTAIAFLKVLAGE